jgi:2-oxoisovalerate dehydrogenase E1 component
MVFRNWPRSYLSRSDGCLGQDEHITDAQKSRCFGRDIPLHRLFSQWQEKPMVLQKVVIEVSILELRTKIIGMISHLGPQLGVADGIALANN